MARLAFLLAGTALATTCAIALLRPAPDAAGLSDQEKLRDLLDPSRAAALACKGPRKTGLAAFLAVASANAAEARAGSATPRERALISALGERYSSAADADRAAFDAAYAEAMVAVAEAYRDADHIVALAAEAIMDTQPWNYWHPGGQEPLGRAGEALALLERVLDRTPDHPGAIHL